MEWKLVGLEWTQSGAGVALEWPQSEPSVPPRSESELVVELECTFSGADFSVVDLRCRAARVERPQERGQSEPEVPRKF